MTKQASDHHDLCRSYCEMLANENMRDRGMEEDAMVAQLSGEVEGVFVDCCRCEELAIF